MWFLFDWISYEIIIISIQSIPWERKKERRKRQSMDQYEREPKVFKHFTNAHRIQIWKYAVHFPCEWNEKRKINKRNHWKKRLKCLESELNQVYAGYWLLNLCVVSYVGLDCSGVHIVHRIDLRDFRMPFCKLPVENWKWFQKRLNIQTHAHMHNSHCVERRVSTKTSIQEFK